MTTDSQRVAVERFEFARHTFAFENETVWEYLFDSKTGKTEFRKRVPRPPYSLRCFVLTRASRQFFYHVCFNPEAALADDETYRRLITQVMARNPRERCESAARIVIPGMGNLHEFSVAKEELLKATCGGAWQSYVVRSHWRMVFPISRAHQAGTAESLVASLRDNRPPIIHLVKFPALTVNHSMVLYSVERTDAGFAFQAYDPNNPLEPVPLNYDRETRQFILPPTRYWAGGHLNIIEIYRGWFF